MHLLRVRTIPHITSTAIGNRTKNGFEFQFAFSVFTPNLDFAVFPIDFTAGIRWESPTTTADDQAGKFQ
jgi:hypothetical protein